MYISCVYFCSIMLMNYVLLYAPIMYVCICMHIVTGPAEINHVSAKKLPIFSVFALS